MCIDFIAGGFLDSVTKNTSLARILIRQRAETKHKLEAYQAGLSYYPSPRYAVRLATAYYNAGVQSNDVMEKIFYFELTRDVIQTYLERYPKEKELSKLYERVQPKSH